jgi:sporulation protein YlmC with PRC-barrel domain
VEDFMAHYGTLGDHRFAEDVQDIRDANVYGQEGERVGNLDDVIFDHETMEIAYVVIEGGDESQSQKFLFPASRVSDDATHRDSLAIDITKQQSQESPRFDEKSLKSEDGWKKYLDEFRRFWEEDPVMHRRGSDRIVTPTPEELRASGNISEGEGDAREASGDLGISAAELFPQRITDVFPDPTPGAHKVTLRPRSVTRAEQAASGVAPLKPRWDAFAEGVRSDRDGIRSECPQYAHEKTRSAA